jgi:hypothetical protein
MPSGARTGPQSAPLRTWAGFEAMENLRPLTDLELIELRTFADVEGKRWKHILQMEYWWRGIPVRDKHGCEYPTLYGLRNTHGPSWLQDFHLPKVEG